MTFGSGGQATFGIREGEILAGKYRVERVLGAGGMGIVVEAQHLQLGTKVAIKFLLPVVLQDRKLVQRFADEARRAAQITSDHVVRVFDVGTLESGAPYMVMEHLHGADLSAYLRQRGPLPIDDAVDFVLQAMEAIAEAHTKGIVHRDLKPANLFCVRRADGKLAIKVLDFGISKVMAADSAAGKMSLTATTSLMGSPFYMSPEQMGDPSSVDARADLWALGVIVFELLTGKVPFSGETVPEVSFKIATRPAPPLRELRPDVSDGLQGVVLTCLEKDRERRYRSVAELAVALLPYGPTRAKALVEKITDIMKASGMSVTGTAVPSGQNPESDPSRAETIAPLGATARRAKGGKALAGMFAGLTALGLTGGLVALHPFSTISAATSALHSGAPVAGPPHSLPPLHAALPALSEAARTEACAQGATQCDASTPQACSAGKWVNGPVTAGQCGAVCTPALSRPRCKGRILQTCRSTGQWEDGAACAKSQTCRDGACVDVGPPPSAKDCDPPYYYDSQGNRVFKAECVQ